MKLKISIAFLLVAAGFLYMVFKGGYFSTNKTVVQKTEQGLSGQALLEQISKFDLRDYKGNKLVINKDDLLGADKAIIHLWASWCAPCVNEVPELIEYSKENPKVKFMIVSLDDYNEDIIKFLKSFPEFDSEKYIRVWDVNKNISGLLKADRLPMSFLIDKSKPEPRVIAAAANWKNLGF